MKEPVNTDSYIFSHYFLPNYKKTPKSAKQRRRCSIKNLVLSSLWFASAIISAAVGNYLFVLVGTVGGLYFLIRGLKKQ